MQQKTPTKVVPIGEYNFRIQAVRMSALFGGLLLGLCAGAMSRDVPIPLLQFLGNQAGRIGALVVGGILLFVSIRLSKPRWTEEATVLKIGE